MALILTIAILVALWTFILVFIVYSFVIAILHHKEYGIRTVTTELEKVVPFTIVFSLVTGALAFALLAQFT